MLFSVVVVVPEGFKAFVIVTTFQSIHSIHDKSAKYIYTATKQFLKYIFNKCDKTSDLILFYFNFPELKCKSKPIRLSFSFSSQLEIKVKVRSFRGTAVLIRTTKQGNVMVTLSPTTKPQIHADPPPFYTNVITSFLPFAGRQKSSQLSGEGQPDRNDPFSLSAGSRFCQGRGWAFFIQLDGSETVNGTCCLFFFNSPFFFNVKNKDNTLRAFIEQLVHSLG